MKRKPDHSYNDKVKLFCENIVVIEEEWFYDMNVTDTSTFQMAIIKHAKSRFNQKINFPRDTKICI